MYFTLSLLGILCASSVAARRAHLTEDAAGLLVFVSEEAVLGRYSSSLYLFQVPQVVLPSV